MAKLTRKDIQGKVLIVPNSISLNGNEFIKIGYNKGIYGWNRSAFKKINEPYTWYVQGYRNFPKGEYVDEI